MSRMRTARVYEGASKVRKRTVTVTPAGYAQRMANVRAIAERARAKKECIRGHNNWHVRNNGRRVCKTCRDERSWYHRHGLPYI